MGRGGGRWGGERQVGGHFIRIFGNSCWLSGCHGISIPQACVQEF